MTIKNQISKSPIVIKSIFLFTIFFMHFSHPYCYHISDRYNAMSHPRGIRVLVLYHKRDNSCSPPLIQSRIPLPLPSPLRCGGKVYPRHTFPSAVRFYICIISTHMPTLFQNLIIIIIHTAMNIANSIYQPELSILSTATFLSLLQQLKSYIAQAQ